MSSNFLPNDPKPITTNTNNTKNTKSKSSKNPTPSSSLPLSSPIKHTITTTNPSSSSSPTSKQTPSNAPVIRKLIITNTDSSSFSSSSFTTTTNNIKNNIISNIPSKSDLPLRPLRSSVTSPKQSQKSSLNNNSLPPPPITTHASTITTTTTTTHQQKEEEDSIELAMSDSQKANKSLNVQVNNLDSFFNSILPSPPDSASSLNLNLLTSNEMQTTIEQYQKELQTVTYTLLMTRKAGHHILSTAQILENEKTDLQQELKQSTFSLNQSLQETQALKKELLECQSQLSWIKKEFHQTKDEVLKHKKMETEFYDLQGKLEATLTGYASECGKLRDECNKLKLQNDKLKQQLDSSQASLAQAKKALATSQQTQAELVSAKSTAEKNLATKEAEILKLKSNFNAAINNPSNAQLTSTHASNTVNTNTNTNTKKGKTPNSTTHTNTHATNKSSSQPAATSTTTTSGNKTKQASTTVSSTQAVSAASSSSSSSSSSSTNQANSTELDKLKKQNHSFRPQHQQQQQLQQEETIASKKFAGQISSNVLSKNKASTTVSMDPLLEKKQANPTSSVPTTTSSIHSSNLTNFTITQANGGNGSSPVITTASTIKDTSALKPCLKSTVPPTLAKQLPKNVHEVQPSSTPMKHNEGVVERKIATFEENSSDKAAKEKKEEKMMSMNAKTNPKNIKPTTRADHDEDVKEQEKALKKETKCALNGMMKPSIVSSSSSTTSLIPKPSNSTSTTNPASNSSSFSSPTNHNSVIATTSSIMQPATPTASIIPTTSNTTTTTTPSLMPTTESTSSSGSPSPLCPKTYNDLARDFLRCLELKDYAGFCSNVAHLVQFEQAQQVNDWNALAIGALWLVAMAGDCHHNSHVLNVIASLNDVREQHDWVIAIESLQEHAVSGSPKEFFHTLDVITDSNMVHQVLPLREILSALRILQRIRFLNAFIIADNRFKRSNQVSLRIALYKTDLSESSQFKQWIEKEFEGTDFTLTITGGGKNLSNVRVLKQKLNEKLKTAENTYKRALEFLTTSLPPVGPGALLNQKPKQN